MKVLKDYRKEDVRLTEERIHHFSKRLEKVGMLDYVEETVSGPDFIVQSRVDPDAVINYKWYRGTKAGNKYLCVVVKYGRKDAYVLTAYASDQVKKGLVVWEKIKK